MASCSLSGDGMVRQGDRYARLAGSVERAERTPRRLVVEFAPGYDRALLDEAVAVERECCPFFEITVGDDSLTVAVTRDDDAPMLDPLGEALGVAAVPR
jgi:hypothetical protein